MDQAQLQLALAHHHAGRFAEADAMYGRLLLIDPRQPSVLNHRGVLAIQTGKLELAIVLLERAVAADALDASVHCNLGEAYRRSGKLDSAVGSFSAAIRLNPQLAVAHNNLGIALASQGRNASAIAAYQRAIQLRPNYAEAHGNLGNVLKEAMLLDDAVASCRTAVRLRPDNAEFHNQLASALAKNGEVAEGIAEFETAIRLNPSHADAHSNLGNALAMQGRVQDAIASCETAVRLRPDSIAAHWNFAVALLRAGDYERGWTEHEWRLRSPQTNMPPRFAEPMWNGEALDGKTILLHAEQGFGDTIQFLRYLPMVAALNGRIIVECPAELAPLARLCPAAGRVIARGDPTPSFDEHAPLMSLPLIFRTRLDTIPTTTPYLRADPASTLDWKQKIAASGEDRLHIGLCWAGHAIHRNDRERSIPFADLAALAMDDVIFHSLQTEPMPAKLPGLRLIDHSAELTDFAQTAALLMNLDHVITVDTAVAHLCGALGVATSMLLATVPDWRWMLHRTDNAWYPTHRLFRRRTNAPWSEALGRVAASLPKIRVM